MENDGKEPTPPPPPDLSEMARLVLPELRRMLKEKREKENGQ